MACDFDAAIFDLDGVITRTAHLHAAAWKRLFDEFLERRAARCGERFVPFDAAADYLSYVDGKPRLDGVRSFLAARGISLPQGDPGDEPETESIHGLGKRKDLYFEEALERHGVQVFQSSIDLLRELRRCSIRTGVVTSSRHGRDLLQAAKLAELFDARIDGRDAEALDLPGKPQPDTFVACAEQLGVSPVRAVAFEDAVSGVVAACAGRFGLVVGIDRGGNRQALSDAGADVVVDDLAQLDVETLSQRYDAKQEAAAWRIEQEGFDAAREHAVETIFTLGNGYLGVRGALDLTLPGSQGDLFVAGVYDRKQPYRPYSEHEFLNVDANVHVCGELVSAPFPFRSCVMVDGEQLDLASGQWRDHRRTLDLRHAMLHAQTEYVLKEDRRATVRARRCASLAEPHLLLQELEVCLESHSGMVELDATLRDPELHVNHPHLRLVEVVEEGGIELQWFSTKASKIQLCIASKVTRVGSGTDAVRWRLPFAIGEPHVFRRYVVVYTSRDVDDPREAALADLRARRWEDFDAALEAHAARWRVFWERADIRIEGARPVEQALRFNGYHLRSAADHDPRVSVGARSLSGRAYEGHVFWDVEIFMLPFYLHTCPDIARNLLLYRHNTLDGARRRARELGDYRGACYAWEATVTGDDVTPRKILLKTTRKEIPIFTGTQQIHVTADVAYGLWRYWQATQDRELMLSAGVEVLLETARFWASRCEHEGARWHIRGVVGPDEYHHSVNDNAYTNWMARLNLELAAWAVDWMQREDATAFGRLAERLALARGEQEEWSAVAAGLYCPKPNEAGIIEQFEGFFDLDDYPLPKHERFRAPISRLFDWDKINRLKLIKQADVLMLPFLFPERFSDATLAANYRYYEPLTDHGSSLSPAVHAALAARLGLREDAERYWRQSLWLDLSNVMANSSLGVHPACMGGTWQALLSGFLGVNFDERQPAPAPQAGDRLPSRWRAVELRLKWRDRSIPVEVRR